MSRVCDSGPFIHLAQVNQFQLLKAFFRELEIHRIVHDEVITEGKGRPGERELREAIYQGWVKIETLLDQRLQTHLISQGLSGQDALVLALAMEKKAEILICDDPLVRKVAIENGLKIIGTVGILIHARLNGFIPNLKTLLNTLMDQGFHLDSQGAVYKEALKKVGEI
ncbi:MAG: DUF3368 domain-containing protein [Candidatus Tectomicrobia bacterium]|uniref:DUF3368 domain-containing protein n=1 Tax=Tectimicrobiota bacterium TaxID=2528274 RepID=A0A933GJS8_UNCTE|nr:DUF3368 domain-containing protein [Candidatus Tectomicrobia bacterium]